MGRGTIKFNSPNRDNLTPKLQITFRLDAKAKSLQEEELLITWVGWFISWLYPAEVVKECISRPSKICLSDDHYFEFLALKSPITIEEAGFKSLILDKNKLEQNVSNSTELWLGDL